MLYYSLVQTSYVTIVIYGDIVICNNETWLKLKLFKDETALKWMGNIRTQKHNLRLYTICFAQVMIFLRPRFRTALSRKIHFFSYFQVILFLRYFFFPYMLPWATDWLRKLQHLLNNCVLRTNFLCISFGIVTTHHLMAKDGNSHNLTAWQLAWSNSARKDSSV